MCRGMRRVAPVLFVVLVLGLVGSPAQASEPLYLGPVGPLTRCVEPGAAMELPVVRRTGGEPLTGRLVRWEYRTDTTDDAAWATTDPVPLDEEGVALPPAVSATVPERAQVRAAVLTADQRWLRVGNLVSYRAARSTLLRDADVRLDGPQEKPWSRGAYVAGLAPLHEVARADGGCAEAPAEGVELDVWASHEVSGERTLLATVPVDQRVWGVQTYLPTTGSFRISIEQVRDEERRSVGQDQALTVVPDVSRLSVNTPRGITATTAPAGHPTWWVARGARAPLEVRQSQDEWRPVGLDGPSRSVEVRFTASGSTTTRRLGDVALTRAATWRAGSWPHTMTQRGRFTLVHAATPTETASRASLDVRFLPRISFPARTTAARAHRPVTRTVTVRDGAGLKAELQYFDRRTGWEPVTRERTIASSQTVRLTVPNTVRGTRTYRVVVWAPSVWGGLEPVVASGATWTVRVR